MGDHDGGRRTAGSAAAHGGDAARAAQRRHLRPDPERRHGLGPARARSPAVPHPQHAGRHPRARRPADRARLSHRALGGRPAHAGGGRGADGARGPAVRGLLLRPVRRPHPGHDRHDGQPRLSQRRGDRAAPPDPLAADAAWRARRRHVRQGPAGDDAWRWRPCATCRACSCRAASRCRRATARTPARCSRSAPASPTARSRCEQAAELGCRACGSPGGGCQFLGTAATSQVVAEALGHDAAAQRAGAVGPADLAATWPGARRARWWPCRRAGSRRATS